MGNNRISMPQTVAARIAATAKAVRDQLCIDCVCKFDKGCGCLDAITAAIQTEREECAKVAEELATSFTASDGRGGIQGSAARKVAAAIRRRVE